MGRGFQRIPITAQVIGPCRVHTDQNNILNNWFLSEIKVACQRYGQDDENDYYGYLHNSCLLWAEVNFNAPADRV